MTLLKLKRRLNKLLRFLRLIAPAKPRSKAKKRVKASDGTASSTPQS